MAWTQDDVNRLKRAIASGQKSVTFTSGETTRTVIYQSIREMLDALSRMEAEVAGPLAPSRTAITQFDRD